MIFEGLSFTTIIVILIFFFVFLLLCSAINQRDKKTEQKTKEKSLLEADQKRSGNVEYLEEQKKKLTEEIRLIVRNHVQALRIRRFKTRILDDNGNPVDEAWDKEIDNFYKTVLHPSIKPIISDCIKSKELYKIINDELDECFNMKVVSNSDISNLTPIEFESYCIDILNQNGWKANPTKGSMDQGVDIIATKNGKKAVFQCKKYSSKVGNKAVQEVIAGKAYESADLAFVVSNANFTPAAFDLAKKSGVHLIHYSLLSKLDSIIE